MAYCSPEIKLTGLKAAADLSSHQFKFVKITADNTVNVCAAVTDVPIGVLQNTPTSGQAAEICAIGVTKVSADEALSAGDIIGTSADAQAQDVTVGTETTVYAVGQVIDGTSAAGGIATCAISCLAPSRAA
jgi:hypothetical protein